ncbi:MAG: Asp-tRNA(Asn)/Glu-tRNA(Gln) amidotransferase GatCAB subunit B, partial [Rhodospirillales bacterium]|nr:Asp-tRNA(Asn)/Glu-tRNA(Gln) amidotransferase GatCAB subunit B [Rhodospirillales bacterium]
KLVGLLSEDTISNRIAKDVFEEMVASGGDPEAIVEEKGLMQITDTSEIEAAVDQVIAGNPDQAQQFKDGNQKVAGWFVGQVMKATQGKANPQMVNDLLRKKLG